MRRRTDWIVLAIVAALLAAGILLAATIVPGATGRASALGTPSPSPSPSVVLQVNRNGALVKSYTLDQIEAMTPFAGFAGYLGKAAHGPDAVVGAKITDILHDALGAPLTAAESVVVAEVPLSTGYSQTFSGAQLLDPLTGFTLFDANTANTITPTGQLGAVLVYSDPDQNVMPPDIAVRCASWWPMRKTKTA